MTRIREATKSAVTLVGVRPSTDLLDSRQVPLQALWPEQALSALNVAYGYSATYSDMIPVISRATSLLTEDNTFNAELAKLYSTFAANQVPLDHEFDEVWDSNVEFLYEA